MQIVAQVILTAVGYTAVLMVLYTIGNYALKLATKKVSK